MQPRFTARDATRHASQGVPQLDRYKYFHIRPGAVQQVHLRPNRVCFPNRPKRRRVCFPHESKQQYTAILGAWDGPELYIHQDHHRTVLL